MLSWEQGSGEKGVEYQGEQSLGSTSSGPYFVCCARAQNQDQPQSSLWASLSMLLASWDWSVFSLNSDLTGTLCRENSSGMLMAVNKG